MNIRLLGGAGMLAALMTSAAMSDVLLVPDSGNDRIWAFSPIDGSLVSDNFVPGDGNMIQPICAVGSGNGTILVTDENADAVFEYDLAGNFLGVFADATNGLDAPFGMTVQDGQAYVVSRAQGTIYRFDLDGSNQTSWAVDLNTPRDIMFRTSDALVTESSNDDILQLGLDGAVLSVWHDSDAVAGIDFPQQIQPFGDGGALVAGFTAPFGLYVYDENGVETQAYTNLITSPRGVYALANGKLLYSGGTRVMLYDPATRTESDVVNESGTSFRFIERLEIPGDLNDDGRVNGADLGILLAAWGPCPGSPCNADLDGNGTVDGGDLGLLLGAWSS